MIFTTYNGAITIELHNEKVSKHIIYIHQKGLFEE